MSSRSRTGNPTASELAEGAFAVPLGEDGGQKWDEDMPEKQQSELFNLHPVPKIRSDCSLRPCPFVSCRHHLWSDFVSRGCRQSPDKLEAWLRRDPLEMPETCSLDVAERGGETLERIGELFGLTRERVRQIQVVALAKLRATLVDMGLALNNLNDFVPESPSPESAWPRPIQINGQHDEDMDSKGKSNGSWSAAVLRSHCEGLSAFLEDDWDDGPEVQSK